MRLPGLRLLATVGTVALVASMGLSAVVRAQDPSSAAFCALYTVDEVNAAFHSKVTASGFGDQDCSWSPVDASVPWVFLSVYWDNLSFEDRKAAFPNGTDVTVAAHQGYYVPDLQTLYLALDQGVLAIQNGGTPAEGVDMQQAITGLGELAVARQATLPPPPVPPTQQPASHADTDLEALIPKTIGGQPVTVQSMAGKDLFASADPATLKAVTDQLAAQGKTLDDVSVLFAYPQDYSSSIQAFRVKGGDASAFAPLLLASIAAGADASPAPGQVAGKDVTVVTVGGKNQYAYPKGDVLWVVAATDPVLTEIFTALP